MSAVRTPAEPNSGAKMSSRLTARIHHTLGRAHDAAPEQAVLYGEELIAAIQSEMEAVFKRGVDVHVPSAPLARESRSFENRHVGGATGDDN